MKNYNRATDERGLTLLEILVAMLIIGIVIVGLVPMLILAIDGNTIARDYTVASKYASNRIEYFENLDTVFTVPDSIVETLDNGEYLRTIVLNDSTTDSTIPGDMIRFDVTVEWTDTRGVLRSAQYSTLMD